MFDKVASFLNKSSIENAILNIYSHTIFAVVCHL